MRFPVVAALTFAALVLAAGAASAREYPWCVIGGDSGAWSCGYHSFEQCMANRRGTAMCNINPVYPPPKAARKSRR